jgi:integrase
MRNNEQTQSTEPSYGSDDVRYRKDGTQSNVGARGNAECEERKLEIISGAGLTRGMSDEKKQGLTFKVAGAAWLNYSSTRRRNPIRENTRRIYGHCLTRWIYPVVGELPLAELKSIQAKKVVDRLVEHRASASVVTNVIMLMQQVIESVKDADGQPVHAWKLDRDVMDAPVAKAEETKAFTSEEITKIVAAASGQYRTLFSFLAATGARIGEALAVEIGADKETTTTISADCRVVYIRTQLLQDGEKQDCPKTAAGVREIDIHPDVAALLLAEIGIRKSGYLFCTESGKPLLQSNLRKNVFDPILVGRARKKMVRVGMKWKQVGTETIPGVIGEKRGFHAFRRFRATHLAVSEAPEVFQKYWLGHGAKTITELYQKAKQESAKRKEWCEKAELGFALPGVSKPLP